jgi:hypothetical protein
LRSKTTNPRQTRRARAIAWRDRLLPWLTAHGKPTTRVGIFHVEATIGEFEIFYRTPFTRLPQRNLTSYRDALRRQQTGSPNLPYGLDVFYRRLKVMNVEWNGHGRIDLMEFRAGPWEDQLARLIEETASA